jgi:hypothetical protein
MSMYLLRMHIVDDDNMHANITNAVPACIHDIE